jgi:hypothetical protein
VGSTADDKELPPDAIIFDKVSTTNINGKRPADANELARPYTISGSGNKTISERGTHPPLRRHLLYGGPTTHWNLLPRPQTADTSTRNLVRRVDLLLDRRNGASRTDVSAQGSRFNNNLQLTLGIAGRDRLCVRSQREDTDMEEKTEKDERGREKK